MAPRRILAGLEAMGQRIKADELREMLIVARKLRISAEASYDTAYRALFTRAACALEQRANEIVAHASEPLMEMDFDAGSDDQYRPVDLRC